MSSLPIAVDFESLVSAFGVEREVEVKIVDDRAEDRHGSRNLPKVSEEIQERLKVVQSICAGYSLEHLTFPL